MPDDIEALKLKINTELLHYHNRSELVVNILGALRAAKKSLNAGDKKKAKEQVRKALFRLDKLCTCDRDILAASNELKNEIEALGKPFSKLSEDKIRELFLVVQGLGYRVWDIETQPLVD